MSFVKITLTNPSASKDAKVESLNLTLAPGASRELRIAQERLTDEMAAEISNMTLSGELTSATRLEPVESSSPLRKLIATGGRSRRDSESVWVVDSADESGDSYASFKEAYEAGVKSGARFNTMRIIDASLTVEAGDYDLSGWRIVGDSPTSTWSVITCEVGAVVTNFSWGERLQLNPAAGTTPWEVASRNYFYGCLFRSAATGEASLANSGANDRINLVDSGFNPTSSNAVIEAGDDNLLLQIEGRGYLVSNSVSCGTLTIFAYAPYTTVSTTQADVDSVSTYFGIDGPYVPDTPSDWGGSVPNSIQDALDILAANTTIPA
jgi:hypothetical protein